MLICILTKNVITSCSVTMMLFLHLEVKPLMTLTTVLYLSCALISGHLGMMLMELTKRREASFLVVFNRPINILCRVSLFLGMALCLLLRLFVFRLLLLFIFFFNDTATTEIYTLSLHDALPICCTRPLQLLCVHPTGALFAPWGKGPFFFSLKEDKHDVSRAIQKTDGPFRRTLWR